MAPNDDEWAKIEPEQRFEAPLIVPAGGNSVSERTRLVVMSDTHGLHRSVELPDGDVLIHAGDFTKSGELETLRDLALYFDHLRTRYEEVICVPGNHDITLHQTFYQQNWERFHVDKEDSEACRYTMENCSAELLEDASSNIKGGLEVYGSPWTPYYHNWAFNLPSGADSLTKSVWYQIPESTDILITHGPPLGRCDSAVDGKAGCAVLLSEVQQRVQPRVHIFGHIHEGRGLSFDGKTLYVNGSNLDLRYSPSNPCFVIDVPHDTSQPAIVVSPVCRLHSREALVAWFNSRDDCDLADLIRQSLADVPFGDDLLNPARALPILVSAMNIGKDRRAKARVRHALAKIYAESFQ